MGRLDLLKSTTLLCLKLEKRTGNRRKDIIAVVLTRDLEKGY